MFSYKLCKPLALLISLLIFILLLGYDPLQKHVYSQKIKTVDQMNFLEIKMVDYVYAQEPKMEGAESYSERPDLDLDLLQRDLVLNLLGKSFAEIKEVMGEPEEQGDSYWYGPHNYMLFNYERGPIRFCSPEDVENQLAVSIIMGGEQEILDARVGMTFLEIKNILGVPDSGPELGLNNLYYMNYFFGGMKNQIPEVFLSFSADTINSPTHEVFLKWEAMGNWDAEDAFQDNEY